MGATRLAPLLLLVFGILAPTSGCGPAAAPAKPKHAAPDQRNQQPPPASDEPALSDAELAALDAAFRDHIAALKDVNAVLQRMFEDPTNRLPPGALDEPGRRAVETRQRLLALMPPPPAKPMLRHEPTPVERVLARYHKEMSQLAGGVVFHLKNATMLAGNDSEALRALAAQLEDRPA